jgi:tetratricopeptide (TPR) repeat protein
MRLLKLFKFAFFFYPATIFILFSNTFALSQTDRRPTDRIIIFPFENSSNQADFNWIGESMAISLSELLEVPGIEVVSNSERKLIQQKLKVPLASLPSLATSLKIAREAGATILIFGKYNILPPQGELPAGINISARGIRVNEGRYLTEEIEGKLITRDISITDALGNLQTIQGQIAYQILYQRDKALPFSQNQMIEAATKIPSRAFEAYIKGLLTQAPEQKEIFFKNAIRIYNEAIPDGTFSEAWLELGHIYLSQQKYSDSIDAFEKVLAANRNCLERAKNEGKAPKCSDELAAEASFYSGLVYWRQGKYEQALGVMRPLAEDLKLTNVFNTLGAVAVQASRSETKNTARAAALLNEGHSFLQKAAESDPEDQKIKFNLALTLFISGDAGAAAKLLREIIAAAPSDGEAFYLLSKSLQANSDPSAADFDNRARVLLSQGNRYAQLEREWSRTKSVSDISFRVDLPQRRDFVSVVLSQREADSMQFSGKSELEALLENARTFYKNGNDEQALTTIRRILASEPMNAESYLLLGKIHLRRGDREQAISALKTAVFWDNKLLEAYIYLARIYLDRRDCLQVKTYVAQANEIAPDSPEVAAIQRQADRCSN